MDIFSKVKDFMTFFYSCLFPAFVPEPQGDYASLIHKFGILIFVLSKIT